MLVPGKLMISDGRGKRRTSGQNQKLNALVARSVDTLGIVLALFGLLGPNYCDADRVSIVPQRFCENRQRSFFGEHPNDFLRTVQ